MYNVHSYPTLHIQFVTYNLSIYIFNVFVFAKNLLNIEHFLLYVFILNGF